MGKDRLVYWLALSLLKGIERFNIADLLERFGSPEGVFSSSGSSLEAYSPELARSIRDFNSWDRAEGELLLASKHGGRIVPYGFPGYPAALASIYDPPCLLYMKGLEWRDDLPSVGIVGTRRPTPYGLRMAETLASGLAGMGASVVSGMARGCDSAAHKGALSAGGFTAAVLGTGVDLVYPGESRKLYEEIAEKGTLISEYPISTPPLKHNFPRRNRIISGLSRGLVVVEAPVRSGSLMTARLALEYGREVFAVPGQVTSLRSSGTNKLIKDGAGLVESAADIAGALSISPARVEGKSEERPVQLEGDEMLILKALKEGPEHIDGILHATGLTAARAATLLLQMELKGFIEQKPGKCFLRRV
ncbi:MAG: DNA-protecting protein DprA [Deltaproteobacteria bacterium]|nr:DNA-protecting protein DprA [Deltaproteobacteria bacterium]MCL4873231.1 DNA-processing protein DprA [bacterium]